jgi:hypothetical protein
LWCYAGTQNDSNFEALQITDFQTRWWSTQIWIILCDYRWTFLLFD